MNVQATIKKIQTPHAFTELYIDPYNKRVRLEDYRGDIFEVIHEVKSIAKEIKAEKLIIKARAEHLHIFFEHGFQVEASIDEFFHGSHVYFLSKFMTVDRKRSDKWIDEDHIIDSVHELSRHVDKVHPPTTYICRKANKKDSCKLAQLYQRIFTVYPTPLHDPKYIEKTMDEGTIYYCFEYEKELVSAASAEVNNFYKNAELTDCATLPDHRKFGLMKILLNKLEEELLESGVFCLYSIARAQSFGMNAVLYQLGFQYRGRLMNNCYIFEELEDMNVWVKKAELPKM